MSDHIGDTHEMVKGYVQARVTGTEEIRARVEKAIPEFIVPDDVKHLLTALQKVEADRNRYIQRAGSAEGRLEVMEADLQALRGENARLKGALDYGFRLVNDHKGEGDFSLAKFVAMARAALSSSPAQEEKPR